MSISNPEVKRAKLTKRIIDSCTPDSSKRILLWDTDITGFCARVYPTGRKTYFFKYRNSCREAKFLKIGVHGNITTEQAREKAKLLALRVSTGEDPSQKDTVKISKPTIEDLAKRYLELHAENEKHPKSIEEDKAMLRNYILKEFANRKIEDITMADVQMLHAKLKAKPVRSNRILSLLHKMFSLAIQWKWGTDNPVSGIRKYQEEKRTRWLQDDEMKRLGSVLDAYPNQSISNIIRLLLLTGARKHEILSATWDQFDLDRGIWTKFAHTTKQKKREHCPLSPSALEILTNMKKIKPTPLFCFREELKGNLSKISKHHG